jgi:ClpP class serine protease
MLRVLEGDEEPQLFEQVGKCAVITIDGPLDAHRGWRWDSYEDIRDRFAAACAEQSVASVLLKVSSPGGDASGCFELARWMQSRAEESGKLVYTFVDDKACSAAYALAAPSKAIYLSETAIVGSIGVLMTRFDYSARNAQAGVRVAFIASGERKADGNPDQPISATELEAQQRIVDGTAAVFFGLVRQYRKIDAKALQAGVFHGQDAIDKGLADAIVSYDQLLLTLSQGLTSMTPFEEARVALQKLSEGDSPDAAAAKRALAALDKKEDAAAEGDEPEPAAATDEPDPAAASDEPATDDDKDKKESAKAYSMAAKAQADLHALKVELARERESTARTALIATRPDFSPEFVKTLAKLPLASVKELVKTTPRLSATGADAASALAASQVGGTAGDATGGAARLGAADKLALDARMGVGQYVDAVVGTDLKLSLGVRTPAPKGN